MKIFFLISFQIITIGILLFLLNYLIHKKLDICNDWEGIIRGFSIFVFIILIVVCLISNIIENYPSQPLTASEKLKKTEDRLKEMNYIFNNCLANSKDDAYTCKTIAQQMAS